MISQMEIDGICATVIFDPDISLYRGEIRFSKCGCDFYAGTLDELRIEGKTSLHVLCEFAEEKGLSNWID